MIQQAIASALGCIVPALDESGIPYAITGSVASSLYGEPYASIDVDVACRMTVAQARALAGRIPPGFYCSAEMLEEAAARCGMANLIDHRTGLKVDLSVLPANGYYDLVLTRRRHVKLGEGALYAITSPEDVILMKLLWSKDTHSAKQWENALSVVRVQREKLDWTYLGDWAQRLGLTEALEQLRIAAGI